MQCASSECPRPGTKVQAEAALRRWTGDRQDEIRGILGGMARRLCLNAPREVFANELTVRSDFAEALLHLDRRNVANARRSVAGRDILQKQLEQRVTQGKLTPTSADLFLLLGDMEGFLDLAIETAPFYRAGRESDARELESVLEGHVFPLLDASVTQAYAALRDEYIALTPDFAPPEMAAWGGNVLGILSKAILPKGLDVGFRLVAGGAS
jgi:hypothetical protein